MSPTLITIMAHKDAQATFARHLPLWEAHGMDLLVYCPANAPVDPAGHRMLCYGRAGHHTNGANRRFKELLRFLETTRYKRHFVFEYDAICLGALPSFYDSRLAINPLLPAEQMPEPMGYIGGNFFSDTSPERRFLGQTFIHPPLMFDEEGLWQLNIELSRLPDDCEQSMWDRMLGLAVENTPGGMLDRIDFLKTGLGFSRNTIEPEHYAQATEAVMNGAILLHGIKTPEALAIVQNAYAKAPKRNGLRIEL